MLSTPGNQGVQRLLRVGGGAREPAPVVRRQGPGPEAGEDGEEAAEAEPARALPNVEDPTALPDAEEDAALSDSEGETAAPEADIYELSSEVISAGLVIQALVAGEQGDLESGNAAAVRGALAKVQSAHDEADAVRPEVEEVAEEAERGAV